ncbi:DUF1045 domain-containing protein [Martelella alba]|uniref:DUF1045 domain-containing protein n=1 Tax=Martelella alba TaxID=2590451 RepID=A0A506UGY6_9HYPH|nr:DUF1045 domain-containing protein [Martelella alba]TPW31647.1 DUF1045 domain-containing protein [Martelella alba]
MAETRRYAIYFSPAPDDALTLVAASWLGRNPYSGEMVDPPMIPGIGMHEIAYHTALPRRYGFHAALKSSFIMADDDDEQQLLRALMHFAFISEPFVLPRLAVVTIGDVLALVPAVDCPQINALAAEIVARFDHFRAPLSEADIERRDPDGLSPQQFANLHRWGEPNVMEAFRFHMALTGPLPAHDRARFERSAQDFFGPVLVDPVTVDNIALFVEEEPGAPFRVHSLHPMGPVRTRRSGRRRVA